jgi:hypothetical protein
MAKFYGPIGFSDTIETAPGVWEETIVEHSYFGDIVRNTSRYQQSGGVNDNIVISNSISIVADPYATTNFQKMRYVGFLGAKWKITNVEVQYPRLVLTIGGEYNE